MPHQQTLLVGVSNSPASLEAVTMACQSAKSTRARVHVVHVIEVRRLLALNAELDAEVGRGEQLLRKTEEIAAQAGVQVQAELLQAREAGPALVDEARSRAADIIVIGLGASPILGDYRVGRTALYVLRHAPMDVWVIRRGVQKRPDQHAEASHA
jgi:nucleotide-binding universal stress UspA family protein